MIHRDTKSTKRTAAHHEQINDLRSVANAMLANGDAPKAFDMLLGLIDSLQNDNERLARRWAASVRARFGRRSEKLTAEELGQLVLAFGATQEQAEVLEPTVPVEASCVESGSHEEKSERVPKKRPGHKGRSKLSDQLPRCINVVEVPENERACIHCGSTMACIGHVDHENVDYIPAKIVVQVERREKIACKACDQDITVAPRQESIDWERRVGMGFLAYLLESKCDDALPIYRQCEQFRRLGFDVPLNTMYGYWNYAAKLLSPVAEVIISMILGEPIVNIDDTKLDYLDTEARSQKKRGHLWCFVGKQPLVGFAFTQTWAAEDIAPWIAAIDGFIQVDDYKGYGTLLRDDNGTMCPLVPPERRLGCMMHVRRRFHQAFKAGDKRAAVPIALIRDIYQIEEQAKRDGLFAPERLLLRQQKSIPLLVQFETWLDETQRSLRPTDKLADAVGYAVQQRAYVRRCFTDGRFEIDNGEVERQIREPAIGRRNFLFSGSAEAAERLAAAYTVVLSARRASLPVREYLIDILHKLANGWPARRIGELVPTLWQGRSVVDQAA